MAAAVQSQTQAWNGVTAAVQDPEVTSRIRKVFNSQEGLTGIVTQLPLDTRFQLENVKVVSATGT